MQDLLKDHLIAFVQEDESAVSEFATLIALFKEMGIHCSCGDISEQFRRPDNKEFLYYYIPRDLTNPAMYSDPANSEAILKRVRKLFNLLSEDQVYPCVLCDELPKVHKYNMEDNSVMYTLGCRCKETPARRSFMMAESEWENKLQLELEPTPHEKQSSYLDAKKRPIYTG